MSIWQGSSLDLDAAMDIAKQRYRPKTRKIDPKFDLHREYLAVVGEMKFAAWSGLPLNTNDDHKGDYGVDFEWYGFSIDVKSTHLPNGRLIYNHMNRYHSDVYVLAITPTDNPEQTELIGWAWGTELLNGKKTWWGKRPPAIVLEREQLHSIDELEAALLFVNEERKMSLKQPKDVDLENEPSLQNMETEGGAFVDPKQGEDLDSHKDDLSKRRTRLTEVPHAKITSVETLTEQENSEQKDS